MLKQTLIFTLMLLTVTTFCPINSFGDGVAETVSDPSLILWLSFDELNGNRVMDHSQHGNHGTVAGNRQLVAGRFGNALTFNGVSDWVEIPHHNSLTVDTSVTVMAWINTPRSQGPNGAEWQGIIAKDNTLRSYNLYTGVGDRVHLSIGNGVGQPCCSGSASEGTFALNTWQHVVAQLDSNGVHRYWINGESAGTSQAGGTLPGLADTASVLVGKTHEETREFLGMIDEVRVWNRALSETEILEQMTIGYGGDGPPVTGVHMYWTDSVTGKIQRANLDGTNIQDLVTTELSNLKDIELDITGNKMYWVVPETHKVQRANLDGTNVEDLVDTQGSPFGIAVDTTNRKMYWSTWNPGKIRRANLDGTNVEDFVTGLSEPEDIDLDISRGKIYWTDTVTNKIQRANLDGSNIEDLVTVGLSHPLGLTLDVAGGKMYWTNTSFFPWGGPGLDKIQRANLDGSNVEDLVTTGLVLAIDIALDVENGKMYWTDCGTVKIQRANLDGTNIEDLITTGLSCPDGLALSIPEPTEPVIPNNAPVFTEGESTIRTVAENTPSGTPIGAPISATDADEDTLTYTLGGTDAAAFSIESTTGQLHTLAPLDYDTQSVYFVTVAVSDGNGGSDAITVTIHVTDSTDPSLANLYMYLAIWSSPGSGEIQRINLDGTNLQSLVTGLHEARDVALDIAGGKMYWVDAGTHKVQRANLDGTNVEDLVNAQGRPFGIAVDTTNGKMYWSTWNPGKIRRANLDGTNVEDFVTGLSEPEDIDLDISGGKIYWTDTVTNKIQRANLDGSNVEDLVTAGLSHPLGIALDVSAGKMYWTNTSFWPGPWPGLDKIQRANLDGTNVEDLVTTGLVAATGIALDVSAGKMYWTDIGTIQRANFDGSNVEDVTTDSSGSGIALGPGQPVGGLRFNPDAVVDQTFTVGTDVSLTLPSATGGTEPYDYTLTPDPPAGLQFDAHDRWLGGTPTTPMPETPYTYTATDAAGASAVLTFTIEVTGDSLDVNGDGKVDVLDLVWVAVSYGMRGEALPADVNADGVVNIQDLVAVAAGVDAAVVLPAEIAEEVLAAAEAAAALEAVAGAPVMRFNTPRHGAAFGINAYGNVPAALYGNVAAALADVRTFGTNDVRLRKWMPLLEGLLQALAEMGAIPETTALLPNYPNPFNPETWIPYHLAQDVEVTLTIYDVRGSVVRTLTLGHQPAGVYESRGRAIYWDGKNQIGEKVASGLYFYTLTAGDFNATRKLLIAK